MHLCTTCCHVHPDAPLCKLQAYRGCGQRCAPQDGDWEKFRAVWGILNSGLSQNVRVVTTSILLCTFVICIQYAIRWHVCNQYINIRRHFIPFGANRTCFKRTGSFRNATLWLPWTATNKGACSVTAACQAPLTFHKYLSQQCSPNHLANRWRCTTCLSCLEDSSA
jgi:hypothetical protein